MAQTVFEKLLGPVYHVAGGLIFLVLAYAAQPGSNLFSWHPILMSLAIAVLMGKAVVTLNSSFNIGLFESTNRVDSIAWHFYLQIGSVITMVIGLAVIYLVKNLSDKPHFTSWHGVIGLGVVISSGFGILGGLSANNAQKFRNVVAPAQIKWGHSFLGTLLFSVACVTMALGVSSNWALAEMSRLQRCLVGSLALGMAAIVWDQARRGFLLRPFRKSGGTSSSSSGQKTKTTKQKK